jgi:hypothetical protein
LVDGAVTVGNGTVEMRSGGPVTDVVFQVVSMMMQVAAACQTPLA